MRYDVESPFRLARFDHLSSEISRPKPAILLLHGKRGRLAGWSHVWALALAQAGFVTLPWRYSKGGSPWCAATFSRCPGRDGRGSGVVANRTWCLGPPCLYGESRGAEHGLPPDGIDGARQSGLPHALVLLLSASDTIVGAFIESSFRPDSAAKAARRGPWEGTPIRLDPTRAWCWRGTSKAAPHRASPIEIERYDGPVFLSHGEKDDVWSVNRTKRLEQRLRDAGRSPEVHYYAEQSASADTGRAESAPDPARRFFRRYL